MAEETQNVLDWFKSLSTAEMANVISDETNLQGLLNAAVIHSIANQQERPENLAVVDLTSDQVVLDRAIRDGAVQGGPELIGSILDPEGDFRTPGMPDSTPIDAEDLRQIYIDVFRTRLQERLSQETQADDGAEETEEGTTLDPQDLNQDGTVSDQEAAVNLETLGTLDRDTDMSALGILGSIFGPDFDLGTLDVDLVNLLLRDFDRSYDDFQNDLIDESNDTNNNNNSDNNNTTDPNTNTNTNGTTNNNGTNTNTSTTDTSTTDTGTTDTSTTDTGTTDTGNGDDDDMSALDRFLNLILAGLGRNAPPISEFPPGQGTGIAVSEGSQADARAEGGEARVDARTGDQSIGDTILETVTNIIENPVDVVGAALVEEAIRRYEADQLKEASDAELALLRELMGTREDVYAPFYSLGGTAPGPDGVFNTADDVSFLDATLDAYRTAAMEPFEPRIDLMDERGVGQLVDVQPNRFDIAQMISEIGRGAVPDAMFTEVNQINPFNPQDEGLRFLQDEGRRAIEASAAAQGRLNTGGTLQELQNQAIGTAAQYAGNLADIGRTQDTSRLGRDQQFYNQLFGTQEQRFGQDLQQLAGIQAAQDAQDRMQLEADAARFESGQQLGQQVFDQAARVADQDFRRNQLPMNNLANLIDIANRGATGLTGGETGYLGAGYSSSANSPYSFLADNSIRDAVNRENVYGRVLGNRFTNLFR